MKTKTFLFLCVLNLLLIQRSFAQPAYDLLQKNDLAYKSELSFLRKERGIREVPDEHFFLFGMGDRTKLLYKNGVLKEIDSGKILGKWKVGSERIFPSSYAVSIQEIGGKSILIYEDRKGVWLLENKKKKQLSLSKTNLPDHHKNKYPQVLKVLHHETLINIVDGVPVPNLYVYKTGWYRDGAIMAMVLQKTKNVHLIKNWILNLKSPYDKNNGGNSEADNLGEVLFLISLVSDKNHSLVPEILNELKKHEEKGYIVGITDFTKHPVYQTIWAKLGLKLLGLPDPYILPDIVDNYANSTWWYTSAYKPSNKFPQDFIENYPYLPWAQDHFLNEKTAGIMGSANYPLSWEAVPLDWTPEKEGNQAKISEIKKLSDTYFEKRIWMPHSWHAAEMYLLLYNESK